MDNFTAYLLTMLGHLVPQLLAAVAATVLLWSWAPVAPGRTVALTGAAVMVLACVLRGAGSLVQGWLAYGAMSGGDYLDVLTAFNILLTLVESTGVVLLAWGAVKAMQAARRPG